MMAIIPAGTTNDYARALRIPREDPLAAARVILKGRAAKMDIGQSNDSYFINIAAGGSLSELTYSVPSKLKSMYGYLAYVVKGAEMLTSIKPMDLHIKYDDGEFKGKSAMFFLALTNSVGGFEQIVPDAKLDDGKFTLLIVKTTKFAEILNLITEVLKGKHINNPNLIYAKSERVEVSSLKNDKIMINLDGEYGGDAPVTFINHKQHIKIVANIDDAASDMLIDAPVELND
jgi:diacylglycerol kinase (ATP)